MSIVRCIRPGATVACLAALALGLLGAVPSPANAHWLTHILKEAGDAAGDVGRHVDLPDAKPGRTTGLLSKLHDVPDNALVASATPEGHWRFSNGKGEVFTAGTPDEMGRVMAALGPDGRGSAPMVLYIPEETVRTARDALTLLPEDARLHVVVRDKPFALQRLGDGWQVEVRSRLRLRLGDPDLDREAFALLRRRISRYEIRTLSVVDGGPKRLPSTPRFESASDIPLADKIDPAYIASALAALRGQTAMIVGRLDNGVLHFAGGGQRVIDDLMAAAREADVNLIVLDVPSGRQPGGRNWFWQPIGVPGLDEAARATEFADFLNVLAGRAGTLRLSTEASPATGRFRLIAVSEGQSLPVIDDAGSWLGDAVEFVSGEVLPRGLNIEARDNENQLLRDMQLFSWMPLPVQMTLLASIVAGLVGFAVVREWWAAIWPRPLFREGQSRLWHGLRHIPRRLIMVLVFLPLAGIPALVVHAGRKLLWIVMLPVRFFSWVFRRSTA